MPEINKKDPWGKKKLQEASESIKRRTIENLGTYPKNAEGKMEKREAKKADGFKVLASGMKVFVALTNLTVTEKKSSIVLMGDTDSIAIPVFEVIGYGEKTESCEIGDLVIMSITGNAIDVAYKNRYFKGNYDGEFENQNRYDKCQIVTENSILGTVDKEDCRELTSTEVKSLFREA